MFKCTEQQKESGWKPPVISGSFGDLNTDGECVESDPLFLTGLMSPDKMCPEDPSHSDH